MNFLYRTECIVNFISFTGVIVDYFEYVLNLKFDEKPEYDFVRRLFNNALHSVGKADEGSLIFEFKTYELEIELDISSDADVDITVSHTTLETKN